MSELQIKFYINNKTTEWYFLIFLTKCPYVYFYDIYTFMTYFYYRANKSCLLIANVPISIFYNFYQILNSALWKIKTYSWEIRSFGCLQFAFLFYNYFSLEGAPLFF